MPQDISRSLWNTDTMHGMAVCAILGRAVENGVATDRPDVRPVRLTVDLFRPARMTASRTEVRIVRDGSRIVVADVDLLQDDVVVARASGLFMVPTEEPDGAVWAPEVAVAPPPLDVAPVTETLRLPLFNSGSEWSADIGVHQNAGRKQTWQTGLHVVAGEEATPFQVVAGLADFASMMVNWGEKGVEYINADLSVSLSRMPVSRELGVTALTRTSADGIATGVATIFDRQGPLGTATACAIANAQRTVDFTTSQLTDGIGAPA